MTMVRVGLLDEVIVVDDGSVDATARLASAAGPRFTPICPDGQRSGAATAGDHTKTDILLFVDGDVTNFLDRS